MSKTNPFKWHHYQAQTILRSVRWHCTYPLSYRQVAEMVNERGMDVHHTTVERWVQEYGSELDKRCRPYLRPTNDLWRIDETYIKVKGKDRYLYRAVDSFGNTIDFLLTGKRDAQAAKCFCRKALKAVYTQEPRVINVDKSAAYPKAINELKEKEGLSEQVELRGTFDSGNDAKSSTIFTSLRFRHISPKSTSLNSGAAQLITCSSHYSTISASEPLSRASAPATPTLNFSRHLYS